MITENGEDTRSHLIINNARVTDSGSEKTRMKLKGKTRLTNFLKIWSLWQKRSMWIISILRIMIKLGKQKRFIHCTRSVSTHHSFKLLVDKYWSKPNGAGKGRRMGEGGIHLISYLYWTWYAHLLGKDLPLYNINIYILWILDTKCGNDPCPHSAFMLNVEASK